MNLIPRGATEWLVRRIAPFARALIHRQVRPTVVTTMGALVVVAAGAAFAAGAIRLGGALLLASGLFDVLDQQMARQGGKTTTFGAFYESTLDRAGEAAVWAGLAIWFLRGVPETREPLAVGAALLALVAALLGSYARARAEGLGLDCRVGIVSRPERVLLLGTATVVLGAGPEGRALFWVVVVLAVLSVTTLVQRVRRVARVAGTESRPMMKRDTLPGVATARRSGP